MNIAVNNSQENSSEPIKKVIAHPLVLLSILDHSFRVSAIPDSRAVGVLLGHSFNGVVDVSNSYAVPFSEDIPEPNDWFIDVNYVNDMLLMFKKTNAKENIVGWYSTGIRIRDNDLDIHRLFHEYVQNPILVVTDVQSEESGIPIRAFYDVEEVKKTGTKKGQRAFVLAPSEIGADEPEEIGVEQLLRDVNHTISRTLETEVSDKLTALEGLHNALKDRIRWYSGMAVLELFPIKREILFLLQDIVNYLPNPNNSELIKARKVKANDMMCVMFLCSLIRCVIALHNLINNKIMNKELEEAANAEEDEHEYVEPVEFHHGDPWHWYWCSE